MTTITVTTEDNIIEVSQVIETIANAYPAGLRGEKGESGAFDIILSDNIPIVNSLTVLAIDKYSHTLVVASNDNLGIIGSVIGITKIASSAGSYVTIIGNGGLVNGFTGLIVGEKYYLSTNGQLTTSLPTYGFIQQIGVAVTTTILSINLGLPIKL